MVGSKAVKHSFLVSRKIWSSMTRFMACKMGKWLMHGKWPAQSRLVWHSFSAAKKVRVFKNVRIICEMHNSSNWHLPIFKHLTGSSFAALKPSLHTHFPTFMVTLRKQTRSAPRQSSSFKHSTRPATSMITLINCVIKCSSVKTDYCCSPRITPALATSLATRPKKKATKKDLLLTMFCQLYNTTMAFKILL